MANALLGWAVNSTRDVMTKSSLLAAKMRTTPDVCNPGTDPAAQQNWEKTKTEGRDMRPVFLMICFFALLAQPAILTLQREPTDASELGTGTENESQLVEPLILHDELYPNAVLDEEEPPPVHRRAEPLMNGKAVSELHCYVLPSLIFLTFVLLLSSTLTTGANVDVNLTLGDRELALPSLLTFGLADTGRDMWQAGLYPLMLLVLLCSGIWPYARLLLMFFAWTYPSTIFGIEKREQLLLALDSLGKFSLVQTYVLILIIVTCRYHLEVSDLVFDVIVSPHFGFYGFLIATSASMVAGHMLVYNHRRCAVHLSEDGTHGPKALCNHSFNVNGSTYCLSRTFLFVCLVFWMVVIALLGYGMTREGFIFEFRGLAGMALADDNRSAFSLLSIGQALRGDDGSGVYRSTGFGLVLMQAAYYIFTVVTPFVCLLSLLFLFVCPLTLKRQLQVLTISEIANAWSAVEVFTLSIVVALLELSTFASFFVGTHLDWFNEMLEDMNSQNSSSAANGDDAMVCFGLHSSVAWNASFLIVAVVLNSLWVSVALRIAHAVVRERIKEEDDLLTENNCKKKETTAEPGQASLMKRLALHRYTSWMVTPGLSNSGSPMDETASPATRDGDVEESSSLVPPPPLEEALQVHNESDCGDFNGDMDANDTNAASKENK